MVPLLVSEIFGPTLQGEGKSIGKPVHFLRLAGCNLACTFCDTPFTWNWKGTKFKHLEKFDPKKETAKMSAREVLFDLNNRSINGPKALVISGGEPLLQQVGLLPVVRELRENDWWIEVETNGTIRPNHEFAAHINQFNCSPKLQNSGPDNPEEECIVDAALYGLLQYNTVFKFVVSTPKNFKEIRALETRLKLKNIYIMPEGRTPEQLAEKQRWVAERCAQLGYNFSPRLHIDLWGTKRGV